MAERFPWYTPQFYEELGDRSRQVSTDEGEDASRALVYFNLCTHQMTIVTSLWALFLRQEERDPDAWERLRLLAETSGLAVDASLAASAHVSRCIAASGALHSPAGSRAAILGRPLT